MRCEVCDGTGIVVVRSNHEFNEKGEVVELDYKDIAEACSECNGTVEKSEVEE
ncbi:MAG: hypothetical protein JXR16_04970 [Bermanella sp.]